MFEKIVYGIFKKFLSIEEIKSRDIGKPQKIIVVRQHNQLGDLLAGVSLFRAIKDTFPESTLTLIVSPLNYQGVIKNKFIDEIFIFDKKKLLFPSYLYQFIRLLRKNYDLAIVPVTVSISFTSNLIARFSNSKIRIGAESLDGKKNKSAFLFDRRIQIDWRKHPDCNVAEIILDIVRPFGINTNEFKTEITFDKKDLESAEKFIKQLAGPENKLLLGLHIGAGKIPNRWSLKKYVLLIERLKKDFPLDIYLTGSSADKEEINYVTQNISFKVGKFLNRKISEVAALISKSDLFISNDTGIMHVAGTTNTPQISIFGPTNPYNWAPLGKNKYFIRKSDFIDDIEVDDVFNLCKEILTMKKEKKVAG